MSIKLVAIDLDETLLRQDKTYDRDRFQVVLEKLEDAGILMFIVTGNTYSKVGDYFNTRNKQKVYFGSDNGNYLIKSGVVEREIGFSQEETRQVLEYLDSLPAGIYPILSNGSEMFFRAGEDEVFETIKQYNPGLQYIDSFSSLPAHTKAMKLANLMTVDLSESKRIADAIYEKFPFANAVTSGGGWMDVYHRDGGKGKAVQFLQEKYGILQSDTMCFGDSLNDYSMMQVSDYSIAMGNADPQLTEICNYQIGHNNDQSVLEVLEEMIRNKTLDFLERYRR